MMFCSFFGLFCCICCLSSLLCSTCLYLTLVYSARIEGTNSSSEWHELDLKASQVSLSLDYYAYVHVQTTHAMCLCMHNFMILCIIFSISLRAVSTQRRASYLLPIDGHVAAKCQLNRRVMPIDCW